MQRAVYSMQHVACSLGRKPCGRRSGPPRGRRTNMRRLFVAALLMLLAGSRGALAREAVGTLKQVDADKGTMVVFADGKDRVLKIADDVKVMGTDGKPL